MSESQPGPSGVTAARRSRHTHYDEGDDYEPTKRVKDEPRTDNREEATLSGSITTNTTIKLEQLEDEDTRHLYDEDDTPIERDPITIQLGFTETIEVSSDDDTPFTPMRIRDKRVSFIPKTGDTPTKRPAPIIDRRNTIVIILKEVATQTNEEPKTTDVSTSTDGTKMADSAVNTDPEPAKKEAEANTDPVPETKEVGVNVNVYNDLFINDNESDEEEDSRIKTKNTFFTYDKTETSETAPKDIYYQCIMCSCYYLSFNLLRKHCESQHSKTLSDDITKVAYDPKCKYCPSHYVFSTYNKHIKSKHAERFNTKSNVRKQNLTGPYECVICSTKFLSYNEAKRHRKVHNNIEQKFILRKIKEQAEHTTRQSTPVVKPERASGSPSRKILVSKSFLFQCPNCQLNFFTYRNGLRHRIACEKGENKKDVVVNCSKCHKKFLSVHIRLHYLQHDGTNEFKTQMIVDGIEYQIIYQCGECKVGMDEKNCRMHMQMGCGHTKYVLCSLCDVKIDTNFMATHAQAHEHMMLTKDQLILVEV